HRAHPAAHAPRSRSWRNRGSCASSRREWIRDEYRKAPAARRAGYLRYLTKGNPYVLSSELYSPAGALKPAVKAFGKRFFPLFFNVLTWPSARHEEVRIRLQKPP